MENNNSTEFNETLEIVKQDTTELANDAFRIGLISEVEYLLTMSMIDRNLAVEALDLLVDCQIGS